MVGGKFVDIRVSKQISGTHTNNGRFRIKEHSTRYIFAIGALLKQRAVSGEVKVIPFSSSYLTAVQYIVFEAEQLPERLADLSAALSQIYTDNASL